MMPLSKKLKISLIKEKLIFLIILSLIFSIFIPIKPLSIFLENKDIIFNRTLSFYLSAFTIIFNFFNRLKNRSFSLKINNELFLIFLLFLYCIFNESILHKSSIINDYYASYFINTLLLISLVNLLSEHKKIIKLTIDIYIYFSTAISLILINKFISLGTNYSRLTFMGWNQNEISIAICIGLSYILYKLCNSNTKPTNLFKISFLFIINFFGMYVTGTRSTIIIFAIILFLSFFYIFKNKPLFANYFFYSFNIILSTSIFIFFRNSFEMIDLIRSKENILAIGGRIYRWQEAIQNITDSPMLGKGYSNLLELNSSLRPGMPHNFPLEIFASSGIFGFSLTLIIGILLIYKCKSNNSFDLDKVILFIPIIASFLLQNIVQIRVIWFCTAIFISLSELSQIDKCNLGSSNLKK